MKKYIFTLFVVLLFVYGCTVPPAEPTAKVDTSKETEPVPEPEPDVEPEEEQEMQEIVEEEEEPVEDIPEDIKEIMDKSKTRLLSYSYVYKQPGSDVSQDISVKGDKMKIVLSQKVIDDDEFYNTIFLDSKEKTAEGYCIGYSVCEGKAGKAMDLDFSEEYIKTPVEWVSEITSVEVIDERQVEGRDAYQLDTNIGTVTLEDYYGFIYYIKDGSNQWEFTDTAFNSVKDSDVMPE